ncbi:uncharacterized protein LOC127807577 isoform X1 [Diospyros lotus]|uniref:uncharacterized protein LOC127807577 isoform X1 n=1 Tax=Diospyros lotus TaxID=55363 RepID=UPI00225C1572|nr:uncharacterized protein LOC127807577 isoform X1 [Diospyros lotus]
MEAKQRDLQIQAPGESESPPLEEATVSTFSTRRESSGRCSNSQTDSEEFYQHKDQSDLSDKFCDLNLQFAKPEECDAELPPIRTEENKENMSFLGPESFMEQGSKHEVWGVDLPQQERKDNYQRHFLCQEMSELEEGGIELPSVREKNDEQRTLLSQQIATCSKYTAVPEHKNGGGDQKTQFISQVVDKSNTGENDIELKQESVQVNTESSGFVMNQQIAKQEAFSTSIAQCNRHEGGEKGESNGSQKKLGKYFYYDLPLSEETGVWIPVSVPPLSECDHEEWAKGLNPNGGYFPEVDMGWSQYTEEDKELTMWDVVSEMLLVARGKMRTFASGDISKISWMSSHLVEQAWKEMAQTLTEANFSHTLDILEADPPKWLPDSASSHCMLCSVRFHPIMCTRHHCRFCGGIYCGDCTRGRSLLPVKFHVGDPQRVCDVCYVRLESVQPYLMDQVSHAAQLPTHDVTDLSTLRSWLNFPWGQSMEYEIYKATNTIRGYVEKVSSLGPEKAIPDSILWQAKGLAILTVIKVGTMVTYNTGTGVVIARRQDGSWSPPSAISSFGVGWGAQVGGELIDFIVVLRTNDAIETFCSDVHFAFGAGLSAAVGIFGRAAGVEMRAGDGGYAATYTYSCSKGAFVGCSLEGSVITTRTGENSRFYGSQTISASDIILGSLPRPPAAAILYRALGDLYQKLENVCKTESSCNQFSESGIGKHGVRE